MSYAVNSQIFVRPSYYSSVVPIMRKDSPALSRPYSLKFLKLFIKSISNREAAA